MPHPDQAPDDAANPAEPWAAPVEHPLLWTSPLDRVGGDGEAGTESYTDQFDYPHLPFGPSSSWQQQPEYNFDPGQQLYNFRGHPEYLPAVPDYPPYTTYPDLPLPLPPRPPPSQLDTAYAPSPTLALPHPLEQTSGETTSNFLASDLTWDRPHGLEQFYEAPAPFLHAPAVVDSVYPPTYPLHTWAPNVISTSSIFPASLPPAPSAISPPFSARPSRDSPRHSAQSSHSHTASTSSSSQASSRIHTPQHSTSAPQPHASLPSSASSSRPNSYSSDAAVALAASNRALHHVAVAPLLSATAGASRSRSSAENSPSTQPVPLQAARGEYHVVPGGGSKKPTMEINSACYTCGDSIGKLVLRGQDVETMVPQLACSCIKCVPLSPPVTNDTRSKKKSVINEASYLDTLSAAVDLMQGVKLEEFVGRPVDGPQIELPEFLKKEALKCDVCLRIVGAGAVTATTDKGPSQFVIEVICARCDELYAPCSDCGGGGGRLTPGRWRCKELFPDGRRNCQLSHARQPTVEEITFNVYNITEISPASLPSLEARCFELYFNARMGLLARPEFLSQGDGLCTTFAQAEKMTVDLWNLSVPNMKVDVEATREIRRYLGLQTATPHRRRSKQTPEMLAAAQKKLEKVEIGFIIMEHDLKTGAVFVATVAPWATTRQAFDALTIIIDTCIARMKADLLVINKERLTATPPLPPYPPVTLVWILIPFKSDSRVPQSLNRRGFRPLEEHLELHPDTNMKSFPPHREIFIPQQFLQAWKIYVMPVAQEDEDDVPPSKRPRRDLEE